MRLLGVGLGWRMAAWGGYFPHPLSLLLVLCTAVPVIKALECLLGGRS